MAVVRRVQFVVILILLFISDIRSEIKSFNRVAKAVERVQKYSSNPGLPVKNLGSRKLENNAMKNFVLAEEQKARSSHGSSRKRISMPKISDSPECEKEVKRFCSKNTYDNNFEVLECLQNDLKVRCCCQSATVLFLRLVCNPDRPLGSFNSVEFCTSKDKYLSFVTLCKSKI